MAIINRAELLSKLETVAPALAGNDMLPALQNYLLDGNRLIAYNDRVGIAVPLRSEFKGAVPGAALLDAVSICSHADDIKLEADGHQAKLSAKNAKAKLPLLAVDTYQQIFSMPQKPRDGCELGPEFFAAVDNCLQSVAKHSTVVETTGVTVIPSNSHVDLFATDRMCMTRAKLATHPEFKQRITLSAEFCEQLLRFKDAGKKLLCLKADHALLLADDTLLFGRLLRVDGDMLDYPSLLRRYVPNSFPDGMPKPKDGERARIKIALALANRFSDSKINDRSKMEISGGYMSLQAANVSRGGEGSDKVPFKEHHDASAQVAVGRIYELFDRYERMLVRNDAVMLSKGEDLFVASARGG